MAKWTETLEPYIKVQEEVKSVSINPTTGEDLIIGCVIFADAGPSVPTLISGQKEFRTTFASQDLTQEYLESLNKLYDGDNSNLPATMWANAYRLAGSNTLLVMRAGKTKGVNFVKSLDEDGKNSLSDNYLLKDGVLLKKVDSFKIVINTPADSAEKHLQGWAINIKDVGVLGNAITDDGAFYDQQVNDLPELVKVLNETSVFFSPDYEFYTSIEVNVNGNINVNAKNEDGKPIRTVYFKEVYVASEFIESKKVTTSIPGSTDKTEVTLMENGLTYLAVCEPNDNTASQSTIDFSAKKFEEPEFYAINNYNSSTTLNIRIRRFNHDAVTQNSLETQTSLTSTGKSAYEPIESVLNVFTANGTKEVSELVKSRDFYEVAIYDPSLSGEVLFFNVGNISGRGDMTADELAKQMSMIGLNIPKDFSKLGLNYYGYASDDTEGKTQIFADLSVKVLDDNGNIVSKLLVVSDTDLTNAIDALEEDEVYITEGLTDLGNTNLGFQSYLANLAINKNYFYPISTINSPNYMAIGNSISKLSQNSYKLYASAPWDLDSSTLGWEQFISPSVIYWEAVSRNRRNNEEFRSILGQRGGLVQYQSPVSEFNKKTRQMLLTKRVNTVTWDIQSNSWIMNDNYTKQTENTIMSDEGNSRLMIRISKACPQILKQFIGRKISDRLCSDIAESIQYYFKTVILAYSYTVDDYQIFCDYDEALARENKVNVVINVRYSRSLKYINVVNRAFDVGMDISNSEG